MGPIPAYTAPTSAPDGGGSVCRSADRRGPTPSPAPSGVLDRAQRRRSTDDFQEVSRTRDARRPRHRGDGVRRLDGEWNAGSERTGLGRHERSTRQPGPGGRVGDFTFVVDSEPTTLAGAPDDLPTSWITAVLYTTLYQPNYKVEYVPLGRRRPARDLGRRPDLDRQDQDRASSSTTAADLTAEPTSSSRSTCSARRTAACNPDACSAIADNVASTTRRRPADRRVPPQAEVRAVHRRPASAQPDPARRRPSRRRSRASRPPPARSPRPRSRRSSTRSPPRRPPDAAGNAHRTPRRRRPAGELPLLDLHGRDRGPAGQGQDRARQQGRLQHRRRQRRPSSIPRPTPRACCTQVNDLERDPRRHGDRPDRGRARRSSTSARTRSAPARSSSSSTTRARTSSSRAGTTTSAVGPRSTRPRSRPRPSPSSSAAPPRRPPPSGNDEIQWQQKIESDAYTTVKDNPNVQIAEYPDNGYFYIAFNLRDGHLYADKALREAFSMCIDHDKTVEVATGGNGVPVYANIPPFSWAFNPNVKPYTLDVAGRQGQDRGRRLGARLRRRLRQGRQEAVHHPLRPRRPAAAPRVRPARPRPAEGVRHRGQGPGRRPEHRPDPEGPRLPERLRHVPRRVVDGPRPGRLLDLPQLGDPDEGDPFGEQLPGLEERHRGQAP